MLLAILRNELLVLIAFVAAQPVVDVHEFDWEFQKQKQVTEQH